MSEESHSPKPWKWKDIGPLVLQDSNGQQILETFTKPSEYDLALIKAAPYLLRGCQLALEFFYANRPANSMLSVQATALRSTLEKGIDEANPTKENTF
jgi:hypothetical protein